VVKARAC